MPRIRHSARQPRVTLTDEFIRHLTSAIDPEQLGDAWECARRCTENYDPDRRGFKGMVPLFRSYFWRRWRFQRIDLKRAVTGRASRQGSARGNRFGIATARTNMPAFVLNRRVDLSNPVEQADTIAFYKRQCRSRRQAMIVDCVSSGLTYRETGAAVGVVESRVSQEVAGMRYLVTERVRTV